MRTSTRAALRAAVAPVLVVAALVLSACSTDASAPNAGGGASQVPTGGTTQPPIGGTGGSADQPPIGPISTVTTQQQVVRPIDTYIPSTAEILKVIAVETQKVNACLTKSSLPANFAYANPASLAANLAYQQAGNVTHNDLWGFFDTNAADYSRYGYGNPPGLSPGLEIQTGDSEKCQSQADAGLPGGELSAARLGSLDSLPGEGPQVPLNDTRWVAAQSKWSTCMAQAGFHYKTPLDALTDQQWTSEILAGTPSSLQIATATTDIQCKIKTNLVGIGLAIQTAYDQQYIQKNQQALNKYRTEITDYLAQK